MSAGRTSKPKPPPLPPTDDTDPSEFFDQARAALAWKTYLQQMQASADPTVLARVRRLLARYADEPLRGLRAKGEKDREHLALCRAARALMS